MESGLMPLPQSYPSFPPIPTLQKFCIQILSHINSPMRRSTMVLKNQISRKGFYLRHSIEAKHSCVVFTTYSWSGKELKTNYLCFVHSIHYHNLFLCYWYLFDSRRVLQHADFCQLLVDNSIAMENLFIREGSSFQIFIIIAQFPKNSVFIIQ